MSEQIELLFRLLISKKSIRVAHFNPQHSLCLRNITLLVTILGSNLSIITCLCLFCTITQVNAVQKIITLDCRELFK